MLILKICKVYISEAVHYADIEDLLKVCISEDIHYANIENLLKVCISKAKLFLYIAGAWVW